MQGLTHSSLNPRSSLSSEDARVPRTMRTCLATGSWTWTLAHAFKRQGQSSEERAGKALDSQRASKSGCLA